VRKRKLSPALDISSTIYVSSFKKFFLQTYAQYAHKSHSHSHSFTYYDWRNTGYSGNHVNRWRLWVSVFRVRNGYSCWFIEGSLRWFHRHDWTYDRQRRLRSQRLSYHLIWDWQHLHTSTNKPTVIICRKACCRNATKPRFKGMKNLKRCMTECRILAHSISGYLIYVHVHI